MVKSILLLIILLTGVSRTSLLSTVSAQDSPSVLYVPLIGLTSVPKPLALPKGPGNVTYNYAVKNFISEAALTDIKVVDDKCSPIKFVTGDDNNNSMLEDSETWRYTCQVKLSKTTDSIATATGTANNLTATHKAYATVVVGSANPAPLVSIVNITKVAHPLSLPVDGGKITFTYRVNNPGVVPLSDVTVTDNKCRPMSGKLGDRNGNNLLDVNEVWIYTCTTTLKETTTNIATVTASANSLRAIDNYSLTVKVDTGSIAFSPDFPDTGVHPFFKMTVWGALSAILLILIVLFLLKSKKKLRKKKRSR